MKPAKFKNKPFPGPCPCCGQPYLQGRLAEYQADADRLFRLAQKVPRLPGSTDALAALEDLRRFIDSGVPGVAQDVFQREVVRETGRRLAEKALPYRR